MRARFVYIFCGYDNSCVPKKKPTKITTWWDSLSLQMGGFFPPFTFFLGGIANIANLTAHICSYLKFLDVFIFILCVHCSTWDFDQCPKLDLIPVHEFLYIYIGFFFVLAGCFVVVAKRTKHLFFPKWTFYVAAFLSWRKVKIIKHPPLQCMFKMLKYVEFNFCHSIFNCTFCKYC